MTKTLSAAGLGTPLAVFARADVQDVTLPVPAPAWLPRLWSCRCCGPLPRADTVTSTNPSSYVHAFKEKALKPCIYFQTKVNKDLRHFVTVNLQLQRHWHSKKTPPGCVHHCWAASGMVQGRNQFDIPVAFLLNSVQFQPRLKPSLFHSALLPGCLPAFCYTGML